jgi:putative protease
MPVETDENGTYILSSKDLCLVKNVPEIIGLGVDSVKIEGRLKTEYYLATVVGAYRNAIDDYMKDPENYDYTKYMEELDKVKTRSLTDFYFNDRNNVDFQEYEGKQYNPNFEYGGKALNSVKAGEKVVLEIKNKLSVGDTLEILVPYEIKPLVFTIDKMYDTETDEEIDTINPGKSGQSVKIEVPFDVEEGFIFRRKK